MFILFLWMGKYNKIYTNLIIIILMKQTYQANIVTMILRIYIDLYYVIGLSKSYYIVTVSKP